MLNISILDLDGVRSQPRTWVSFLGGMKICRPQKTGSCQVFKFWKFSGKSHLKLFKWYTSFATVFWFSIEPKWKVTEVWMKPQVLISSMFVAGCRFRQCPRFKDVSSCPVTVCHGSSPWPIFPPNGICNSHIRKMDALFVVTRRDLLISVHFPFDPIFGHGSSRGW